MSGGVASDGADQMTIEYVRDRLSYDAESGKLYWRETPHQPLAWNRRYAGKIAGSLDRLGYSRVEMLGRKYYGHRLIWAHIFGRWPPHEIDHINGIPTDNRIQNLREATRAENLRNVRISKVTAVGMKGVTRARSRFRAYCTVDGVLHHIGVFATPEEAKVARDQFAAHAHGEFFRE